jgi:Tol biopolymer transport system component
MKSTRSLLLLTSSFALAIFAAEPAGGPNLAKSIETDIRTLAAERMEGRGLGTKGIGLAAEYIEQRLQALGLKPAFGTSYRQPFPVKTGVSLGTNNKLSGIEAGDWTPLGFSSSGAFSGTVAFVGYGIDAPPIGYHDFDGIDLKGKVALMLRYEPQEKDDASPFDGRKPSRWSAMRYKVLQARERGAVAVVFATGPLQDEEKDKVPPLANDGPESPAGLPVLQVKTSVAERWVHSAGIDLAQFQKDVDHDLRPRSQVLANVTLSGTIDVKPEYAEGQNLVGILPGSGALASEVVVLGAHYDHLGYGGEGSMKPNVHAIHPGADDNASGTAGVLNAAAIVRDELKNVENRRTVLFALFSGEERGLAGSGYFVSHSPILIERIKAMVNLDMIGALREDKVTAFGVDSAPEWHALVDKANQSAGLKLTETGDGYGPSDQTSFYAVHIPVVHFFTGAHERYHTPEDVADAVNFAGEARVVQLIAGVIEPLARGDVTPAYARASSAPAMQGDSRGYGAYLGTVPDYSAMDATSGGVLLSDVRPGAPAEKAGIRGGDRIVEIGGTRIENLYDMTYALQDHKPADTVDVVVLRKGERMTLRATLGSRSAPAAAPPAQQPAKPAALAQPPSQPAATPAPAAPPASPHGMEAPAPKSSFYDTRPGPTFVIKAGKPFEQTFEGEKHLKDIRQLTFGGENAEAYFSPDGTKLIFQATPPGAGCDQQYTMDLATGETKLVSSGKGRTTCGYYRWPQGDRIVYATTEGAAPECPPRPDMSQGYVWPVYPSFDIVEANLDGSNAKRITTTNGYDAEMTWCHRGGKMVFTSMRDGDLDLYEMDEAGNVRRLTNEPGYDGGAFYNADCTEIVWRANHPTRAALDEYKALLAKDLVKPLHMELWLMNADGTNQRPITNNGAANFCPYFMSDGKRIIFASNVQSQGFQFDLWMIGKNGEGLERITTAPGFDGFCVFSPDGSFLVWSSSRAKPDSHEMNLFIARWVE